MPDTTIIYYTSNTEKAKFAENTRQSLLDAKGDLPLVSVSQKPMDFGENICVGGVGASSQNAYRQLWLGAKAAQTRFVCTAEEDCLYPPEYFAFEPPDDESAWLAAPLWVLFSQRGKARVFCMKPHGSESAMVINRELLIARIEKILAPLEYWGPATANGDGWEYLLERKSGIKSKRFNAPVLTFKTDQNMHRVTPHDQASKTRYLEPWGTAADVIGEYGG